MLFKLRNLAIGLCIAPSAMMNIWPCAAAAAASGTLDTNAAGFVVFQAVSVATMAAVPLGVTKAKSWWSKLACVALGLALFSVNFFNAIEVASHVWESATGVARGSEEWVREKWPTWLAVVVELLAMFGPVTWITAIAERTPAIPVKCSRRTNSRNPRKRPPQHPQIATPADTFAGSRIGDIREWYDEQIIAKPEHGLRVSAAYDAYAQWCDGKGLNPVNLKAFGTTMKGKLNVAYEEKSKRGYYTGIALRNAVLKVVQ